MSSSKVCEYCGQEAEEAAARCLGCGTLFPGASRAATRPVPSKPDARLIPAALQESAFSHSAGFHRVNWELVRDWIGENIRGADCEAAWNEAVLLWVWKLRDDLGGGYYVLESPLAVLLCDQDREAAEWLLRYTGRVALSIKQFLAEIAWQGAIGRDVVLVFGEQDDYYQYISAHSPDGEQALSGGACIHSGYTHIALPWHDEEDAANAVAHELTHDCLAHLPLPLWLNEGVALTLQRAIAPPQYSPTSSPQDTLWSAAINWRPPVVWDELATQHFEFWTSQNIQSFWAGTAFYQPGEPNQLSYSLAEILLALLTEKTKPPALRAFLQTARQEDAGQAAALEVLDIDLGNLAGTFLGDGTWRPDRRRIAEEWKTAGWGAAPAQIGCDKARGRCREVG